MKKQLFCVLASLLVQNGYASTLGNTYIPKNNNLGMPSTKLLTSNSNLNKNYSTHTETDISGVTITEYVDNNSKVFAVTWSGPVMPNLQNMLGKYFENYTSSNQVKSLHGKGVNNNDLVVKNSGYLRAFKGVAYLKSMLPPGFNVQNIY